MIIDSHAHACGAFLHAERIVRILDANQVDKVILVPGEVNSEKNYIVPELARFFPSRDVVAWTNALTKLVIPLTGVSKHVSDGNHYVHSLAQAYPDRIIQFYWAMLQRPNILQEIETDYTSLRFKGIKFHQCWETFAIRSALFEMVADFATRNHLPMFIHVGSKQEVFALIDFIRLHPQARIIVGHLFGLDLYIESGLSFENVYFEISSPQLISLQRLNKALHHFGARRLILGSDTPYGKDNLRLNLERVKALPISDEEKDSILGRNMQNLLGLGGMMCD
jgi:predicted TIM-barrel fold metal-dependent hydrolase